MNFYQLMTLLEASPDELEHKIAGFIYGKIQQAAQQTAQSKQPIRTILTQIWQPNHRGVKFFLPPEQFPPEVTKIAIRFPPQTKESATIRVNGNVESWELALDDVEQAALKDPNQLQQTLYRIGGSINHEITHLHHKGADYDGGDETGGADGKASRFLQYLLAPGEMTAHAKEYAFGWHRLFPGQPFNPQQFVQQVIPQLPNKSKQGKATTYFVSMADPSKQSKWQAQGLNLAAGYNQIIQSVNGYVNWYNKQNQP